MSSENDEIRESMISVSKEIEKWDARYEIIKTQERMVKYYRIYYKKLLRDLKGLFTFKAFLRFLKFMFNYVRR